MHAPADGVAAAAPERGLKHMFLPFAGSMFFVEGRGTEMGVV
jgi:hypothetical protein